MAYVSLLGMATLLVLIQLVLASELQSPWLRVALVLWIALALFLGVRWAVGRTGRFASRRIDALWARDPLGAHLLVKLLILAFLLLLFVVLLALLQG